MAEKNTASITARRLINHLVDEGWRDAKIGHYRRQDVHHMAIEVGYVYGECTVRFNHLEGQVDRGTVETMRGVGDDFILRAIKQIDRCAQADRILPVVTV